MEPGKSRSSLFGNNYKNAAKVQQTERKELTWLRL